MGLTKYYVTVLFFYLCSRDTSDSWLMSLRCMLPTRGSQSKLSILQTKQKATAPSKWLLTNQVIVLCAWLLTDCWASS